MSVYTGTGVALVTPFNQDGTVDTSGLTKLVNHVIEGGVEYLVVLGTTGEAVTLDTTEKALVIKVISETNNGRVPMVLGVGGNNTTAVLNQVKQTDLSDFSAILSVAPYYNKPSQEGMYQHFKAIAEACPIDVILYNVPGRTSSNIFPATALRLANEFDNVVAIKEASGDLNQVMEIIQKKPSGFEVLSGDDALTTPMILMGAKGVISVMAQGAPKSFSAMVRYALNGDVNQANILHYELLDMMNMIFEEGNPAGIKSLLSIQGICGDDLRLPLVKASEQLHDKIEGALSH